MDSVDSCVLWSLSSLSLWGHRHPRGSWKSMLLKGWAVMLLTNPFICLQVGIIPTSRFSRVHVWMLYCSYKVLPTAHLKTFMNVCPGEIKHSCYDTTEKSPSIPDGQKPWVEWEKIKEAMWKAGWIIPSLSQSSGQEPEKRLPVYVARELKLPPSTETRCSCVSSVSHPLHIYCVFLPPSQKQDSHYTPIIKNCGVMILGNMILMQHHPQVPAGSHHQLPGVGGAMMSYI